MPCPVSAFLLSLTPPQPALLGVFKTLGIVDKDTFDAFALLLRREAWQADLVREGQITLFQSATLSAAIHRYVKTGHAEPMKLSDFSSDNAVHNFLLKITPPLPHLIPCFRRIGIVDEQTLFAAAHLEAREARLKKLGAQGTMTPLEARLVGEAMAELVRGRLVVSHEGRAPTAFERCD
ncbi:hypothetical protein EIP86_004079 [Pleurotus ostreatoroseus]|nr:hypothetical protein EIP86_004079 [Pleurotus ostreatoroseus]